MAAVTQRARGPVLGLDLAGSPRRPTGWCVLGARGALRVGVAFSDAELARRVTAARPALVVVDAPLSLPLGRRTIDDRGGPHLRACDRELLRLGIRFFPLTLGPMRMLTSRGMRLAADWRSLGFEVVEGYPGASQDLAGIPRKGGGLGPLRRGLLRLGLRGDLSHRGLTGDELDAVTIAWVGREHLAGRGWLIGDADEGQMLLPRPLGRAGDFHGRRIGRTSATESRPRAGRRDRRPT